MENSKIIEIIRLLIIGFKGKWNGESNVLHETIKRDDYFLWNCDYLLNQVIRHYNVPQERWFYSKKAKELWINLGLNLDQLKKTYDNGWVIVANNDVKYQLFSGSSNKSETCTGDFKFNNVFHIEHIVPIKTIIKELTDLNAEELTDDNIIKILNKICVARILKTEDRMMHNKTDRGNSFKLVYHDLYLNRCDEDKIWLYSNVTDKLIDDKLAVQK